MRTIASSVDKPALDENHSELLKAAAEAGTVLRTTGKGSGMLDASSVDLVEYTDPLTQERRWAVLTVVEQYAYEDSGDRTEAEAHYELVVRDLTKILDDGDSWDQSDVDGVPVG